MPRSVSNSVSSSMAEFVETAPDGVRCGGAVERSPEETGKDPSRKRIVDFRRK